MRLTCCRASRDASPLAPEQAGCCSPYLSDHYLSPFPLLERLAPTVIHVPLHPKNQVALISGGGSGHEPSFAGYVGEGLLSAAV